MKITFLGSAAADGIPLPYCSCPTCSHARKHKGKNTRKRCSYLINDDLLVDMGPDLFASCGMYGVDLLTTKYALITHSHEDHFFNQNLTLRAKGFHRFNDVEKLTFVAPPSVMTKLNQSGSNDEKMGLERKPILPYGKVDLPPYHVQSVKASHFPTVGDAMNYIIDDGKRKIMIASDTGVYKDEVWPYLEDLQLDLLIIEATGGTREGRKGGVHLSIEQMQMMVEKMKTINAVTEHTTIYATHFSHHNVPPHEELKERLEDAGVGCVHDGLVLEV